MTGIEIAPLAVSAATKVATKLVKSFTFRWRVSRRVSRAIAFNYPKYRYRWWLNAITLEDLVSPIERGAPALAIMLNQALEMSPVWRGDDERQSKAIALVEATYRAMVLLVDSADGDALRDYWSASRHAELVLQFDRLLAGFRFLSREDQRDLLLRESDGRREVRLRSFDRDLSQLGDAFDRADHNAMDCPVGRAVVLVGPFGSGKSEVAEGWFRRSVIDFARNGDAPRPIWVHASDLAARSLSSRMREEASEFELSGQGIRLVIDGLDEVGGAAATRIADEARAFVGTYVDTSVLMTCRPGVLISSSDDTVLEPLSVEAARELLEQVSGSPRASWSWDASLIEAIRRPFFALAAGVVLADGSRPTGQADLIRMLVEKALSKRGSSSVAVTSSDLFELLVRLAVNLTDSANEKDGITFQERQQVLTSTLAVERTSVRVEFSLPIFQQWFAAQAVLDDHAAVRSGLSSPETFDRWRWPLAIAGLAAQPAQLDAILSASFEADPAAGSWILSQIAEGHRWFRDDNAPISVETAPPRLLGATRTLINAIGPLAPLVFPIRSTDQRIQLGVRVDGNRVSTGWSLDPVSVDEVVPLPDGVHPFAGLSDRWMPDRSGAVAEGDEWPWILSKHRIESSVLEILNRHPLLGPKGGIWHRESLYRAARVLADDSTVFFAPLDTATLIGTIDGLEAEIGDLASARLQIGGRIANGQALLDLREWIREDGLDTLRRPLPVPDVPLDQVRSGWVWDFFSDAHLARFYAEAYGNAVVAYRELASSIFEKFKWSMSPHRSGEFAVIGCISYGEGWGGDRMPGISGAVIPLDRFEEAVGTATDVVHMAQSGLAAFTTSAERARPDWVERFVEGRQAQGEPFFSGTNPFARGWSHWRSVADDTNHSRPASLFAAGWIHSHLKSIDLADGTFPQLDP